MYKKEKISHTSNLIKLLPAFKASVPLSITKIGYLSPIPLWPLNRIEKADINIHTYLD